jgi:geranylgeranylglycerol-phosphate geranylgeranyltransferase
MGELEAYIEIIRPVNSFMLGLAILVGAFLTGGLAILSNPFDLVLAFLTGFSLTGAAMAVNDYYDRDIDAVNEPDRPIPSGRLKPGEAVLLSALLSVLGLAASWLISMLVLGIAFFSWLIMVVYSAWGKRTGFPGNLMVSTCILAFLSNTGREITKGIVDVEGDSAAGIRTVAVRRGPRIASALASIFYVGAALSSVLPIYFDLVSLWYVPFVLVTDVGLLYISVRLLKEPSRENSRKIKNQVLLLMLLGLIGFAAGSLI